VALIDKKLPADGNMIFSITDPPCREPITAANVREYGRIDTEAEDALLGSMITAVREVAEGWMGRALITQEITASLDWWPEKGIVVLPRPPLIEVVSIKTLTEGGAKTTYSKDSYYTRADIVPGRIVIKNGATPPINTDRTHGGYEIVYDAGYGDKVTDVPQGIRTGLIEWVLFAYENRVVDREPPENAMPLLGHYQLRRI
jgi:uncharacterized phiE125 gp8 family phage protein